MCHMQIKNRHLAFESQVAILAPIIGKRRSLGASSVHLRRVFVSQTPFSGELSTLLSLVLNKGSRQWIPNFPSCQQN